jgi:hypothetical protein
MMNSKKLSTPQSSRCQILLVYALIPLITIPLLILITRLQLDWINSTENSSLNSSLTELTLIKLKKIVELKSKVISYKFRYYITVVEFEQTFLLNFNQGKLLKPDFGPTFMNLVPPNISNYTAGYFSSDFYPDLSQKAFETLNSSVMMDRLFPNLYESSMLWLYYGFEEDQVLYNYPGINFNSEYTPVVREWYYNAIFNENKLIITEPYIDYTTLEYVITISKALKNGNTAYGVAALDVTLSYIKSLINEIGHKEDLYLFSLKGCIIDSPWNYPIETRAFQEEITGISESLWAQLIYTNISNDQMFQFTEPDGTSHSCYRSLIIPNQKIGPTHLLIGCVDRSQMDFTAPAQNQTTFQSNNHLLWPIIGITIILSVINLIYLYLYTLKISEKLKILIKYFYGVFNNGLRTPYAYYLQRYSWDLDFTLTNYIFEQINIKIDALILKAKDFFSFNWKNIKMTDSFLYKKWSLIYYPINKISFKIKRLRPFLIYCTLVNLNRCREISKKGSEDLIEDINSIK